MVENVDGHVDYTDIYSSELNSLFEPDTGTMLGFIKVMSDEEVELARKEVDFKGNVVDLFVQSWNRPRWMPKLLFRRLFWWRMWRFRRALKKHLRVKV